MLAERGRYAANVVAGGTNSPLHSTGGGMNSSNDMGDTLHRLSAQLEDPA